MNDLKCIIIDDMEKAREMLAMHLSRECPNVSVLEKFDNPLSASEYLSTHDIHIVFLDVEMGDQTGFDIFSVYEKTDALPLFIFVTAHSGYAIDAIKADAFDYLLKPINPDELKQVIKKARARIEEHIFQQRIQQTFFNAEPQHNQIQVLVSGGVEFIEKMDIIYLKASRNYTEIFLKHGRQILASKPLAHFEEVLSTQAFVRCHRSYIVNIHEIRAFRTADGGYLELTENHRASITSANKEVLLARMKEL